MKINLHKNARTTPAQRAFIQNEEQLNVTQVAEKLGVSETTVRRWRNRSSVFDKPHTPRVIARSLDPMQEIEAVLIRICLRPGLDDFTQLISRFITPECSRSGMNRCLQKYGISKQYSLNRISPYDLKDHRGTYLYFNRIVFPRLPDMRGLFCIHTLQDVRFRWLSLQVCDLPETSPLSFIQNFIRQYPLRVLGLCYSDSIYAGGRKTAEYRLSGKHLETQLLHFMRVNQLKHFKIDISEQVSSTIEKTLLTCVNSSDNIIALGPETLKPELDGRLSIYNTKMVQRALKQKTPLEALSNFYQEFPSSFQCRPDSMIQKPRPERPARQSNTVYSTRRRQSRSLSI